LPSTAGELAVAYGTRELPELRRQSIEYAGRGPNGVFRDACCRCTALITSRYWTRWRDPKAF
jgi:hypothetical protein